MNNFWRVLAVLVIGLSTAAAVDAATGVFRAPGGEPVRPIELDTPPAENDVTSLTVDGQIVPPPTLTATGTTVVPKPTPTTPRTGSDSVPDDDDEDDDDTGDTVDDDRDDEDDGTGDTVDTVDDDGDDVDD